MLLSMPLWSAGCAPAPIPDSCGWLAPIVPDPGFEMRWTHNEKAAVESYDAKRDRFCGP
jgi:hypothetical protein